MRAFASPTLTSVRRCDVHRLGRRSTVRSTKALDVVTMALHLSSTYGDSGTAVPCQQDEHHCQSQTVPRTNENAVAKSLTTTNSE